MTWRAISARPLPAERCLEACLALACAVKRVSLQANAHIALGQLASARDPADLDAAHQHHEYARSLAAESGDTAGEVAPGRQRPPRHPSHVKPSFLDFNSIL